MDLKKKQAFNTRMGKPKFPRHQNLAKGGVVQAPEIPQRFVTGGQVASAGTAALGGAATGAALGSVVPGIGTAVGAVGGAIVGGLGSLLGGSSTPPALPNITDPVTGAQITDANGTVVASQQALNDYNQTLSTQNGAQNQSDVYNAEGQIASGQGPNPALAQLNQTTGQNVAAEGALAAGQRGASSNVGLIERNAAQQGATTQQQAVGQAATTEANQQLNALNAQAGIAGEQVGELQTGLANAAGNATANQGQLLSAQGQYNSNITGGQGSVNSANTPTNVAAQGETYGLINGGLGGAGSQLVKNSAPTTGTSSGGFTAPNQSAASQPGAVSTTASPIAGGAQVAYKGGVIHGRDRMSKGGHPSFVAQFLHGQLAMASGGKVSAIVSPKEVYLNPHQVKEVMERGADPMKIGHHFPGQDKVKKKDSFKNDVIKTELDSGGVVLPLHVTTHKDASNRGRKFVAKTVAKHMKRPSGA